jgi:hypothetical protein
VRDGQEVAEFPGRPVSAGFASALIGIGLTLLAYLDVWFWPAWPAAAVLEIFFNGVFDWTEMSYPVRSAAVAGLIAVNVAVWAAVARLVWWITMRFTGERNHR